jgi:hypothetical protein
MKQTRFFGWPRWATILLTLALAAFAIVAIRSLREPVLRAAGLALVVNNEPVAPADIIVLTIDSGGAGALEAADLVQSGVSKRVAVFEDPPSREGSEFIRRGFPYEDQAARQIRQLRTLGITDVVQISRVNGTEDEGQVLPKWADEQHLRSIVGWPPRITRDDCSECSTEPRKVIRHMSRFKLRTIQVLTPIDGGKLALAPG